MKKKKLVSSICSNCGHHSDNFTKDKVTGELLCPICGHRGSITKGLWGI